MKISTRLPETECPGSVLLSSGVQHDVPSCAFGLKPWHAGAWSSRWTGARSHLHENVPLAKKPRPAAIGAVLGAHGSVHSLALLSRGLRARSRLPREGLGALARRTRGATP